MRLEMHCKCNLCQNCTTNYGIITLSPVLLQVATTLLLAGPTLTLWIPEQTLFASTSSYPSLVQSLPVQWLIPINVQ